MTTHQKNLVILTDNFGVNYSGGAIATARIFDCIQDEFNHIFVIGQQVGIHAFRHLTLLPYTHAFTAIQHIRSFNPEEAIFYGDFYMSYYFILARVPFYFTYHDNWPEQKAFGWRNYLNSFFYVPIYHWILKRAAYVITVSNYKYQFTSSLTANTCVIRNGINCTVHKHQVLPISDGETISVLMLGNIDDRKYGWALELFKLIDRHHLSTRISVHIFGRILDHKLAESIDAFSFVQLEGFTTDIDFKPYHFLFNTSKIENLSISVCEALANYTPVFCFDVGGLSEVVQHRQNGMLAKPGQIEMYFAHVRDACLGHVQFDFSNQDLAEYDWHHAAQKYKQILL
jgi:glycosyltransferase involved in cell wall biosynthesis